MADNKWISKEKKQQRSDGKWEIVVTICNQHVSPEGTDPIKVNVDEHPYADGVKIGDVPDTKLLKLKNNECADLVYGPYDTEPSRSYTTVYAQTDPGRPLHYEFKELSISDLDEEQNKIPPREGGKVKVGIKSVLPHPWYIFFAYNRPIEFYIKRIHGLPEGWRVSHIMPGFKEPRMLHPLSKHHPVYVELETEREVEAGFRFSIKIEIGMIGFPEDDFHTIYVTHHLSKESRSFEVEAPDSELNTFQRKYSPAGAKDPAGFAEEHLLEAFRITASRE